MARRIYRSSLQSLQHPDASTSYFWELHSAEGLLKDRIDGFQNISNDQNRFLEFQSLDRVTFSSPDYLISYPSELAQ